ncbi:MULTISPECIES: SSI family serine proteinase inhibitor [unclassified Crossiella]|uniref:SSI family serine proteinase inhibitor n=1 Tax=unclassified Crossiella TaxID=2620835 RepID=UPI001FFFB787|nr:MULTISPECIES: SSI family serine proteinase inhibitor [unclassified Crossiella]MCK2238526.1 SSI family serine proteinase inhibitor [Crossiella sp. S99.2]MCK2251904.1 SSI family serine proteinase inhibitor [Crossiella sp. S99.1]
MRQRLFATAAFAALFCVTGLTAGTSNAEPVQASRLTLTIAQGEDPTPVAYRRTLTCQPPGGDHPRAVAACVDLTRANGDFRRLPGDPRHPGCPRDYRPVTVTASGHWQGSQVRFQHTYANQCVLEAATGPVFDIQPR